MCKATLIIPVKNRHDYLISAINSSKDMEFIDDILIIDDHSTTPIEANLFSDLSNHEYIQVLKNTNFPGAQGARLTGIENSKNDILIFLDSDDILLPNGVRSLYTECINDPSLALLYGNTAYEQTHSNRLNINQYQYQFIPILKNLSLCPFSGLMTRKQFIPTKQLIPYLPAWQDDDFCLTIAYNNKVKFIPVLTAQNKTSSDSISTNKSKQFIGLSLLIEKWKPYIIENFGFSRLFLWRIRQISLLLQSFSDDIKKHSKKTFTLSIIAFLSNLAGLGLKKIVGVFFDKIYV